VHDEIRRRLTNRVWTAGDTLPGEIELACEFGCARATVNRALRELVDAGILERRRRAGTRVVKNPVRRATLTIPVIRQDIEARGATWRQQVLKKNIRVPPARIANQLQLAPRKKAMHVQSLHFADREPFLVEERWVNLDTIPAFRHIDLNDISANEWLVQNAPFTHGEYNVSAINASSELADLLNVTVNAAILLIERITFDNDKVITCVALSHRPEYRVTTQL
jgi:GntR family histidine utilization transcriptional repressor